MVEFGVIDFAMHEPPKRGVQNLADTLALAQHADALGFHSFWITEHHVDPAAQTSPAVFAAALAAKTTRIGIGVGGVLLPYYSAYKVASDFRLLSALFPGRIELGCGRGPGAPPEIVRELVHGCEQPSSPALFERKVLDLLSFLDDSSDTTKTKARPHGAAAPRVWVLGASPEAARFAGRAGAAYAYPEFILPDDVLGSRTGRAFRAYREAFRASPLMAEPYAATALTALCRPGQEPASQTVANVVGDLRSVREDMLERAERHGLDLILCGTLKNIDATTERDHMRHLARALRLRGTPPAKGPTSRAPHPLSAVPEARG